MERTTSAQMRAKIVAIEEDALIILVPESGDTIRWPISSIPQPFKMSDDMSLILHANEKKEPQNDSTKKGKDASSTSDTHQNLSESDKRKLLESLMN